VNGTDEMMDGAVAANGAWYVVRSKPRREQFAQVQLIRRGVETFLPRICERNRSRSEPVIGALFPGYLFARVDLDTQYTSVIWTPGVHSMVAFGDTPVPVEPDVVEFLQKRCGPHGLIVATRRFEAGDQVRVVGGPLAGLQGIVQERVSGRDRVRVLMELLRRRTQVTLPLDLLESVAS
jgi:transcriptional antiterminator RfaH